VRVMEGVDLVAPARVTGLTPAGERLARVEAWFQSEHASLLRLAVLLTGELHAAEDIVQDAFLRLHRRSKQGPIDDVAPYARAIVVNLARTRFRRRQRLQDGPVPEGSIDGHDGAAGDRDEMWRALMELSARQRAVMVLRYYEDLSEQQIAQVLGTSTGAVKKYADRARTRMRSLLAERNRL